MSMKSNRGAVAAPMYPVESVAAKWLVPALLVALLLLWGPALSLQQLAVAAANMSRYEESAMAMNPTLTEPAENFDQIYIPARYANQAKDNEPHVEAF